MGKLKGTRHPDQWKSGPDPVHHDLFYQCQRSRAQARFRGEQWQITEQQYIDLWLKDDRYLRKGRGVDQLCMTLVDPELPWHIDNVKIISRLEHYRRSSLIKRLRSHAND
jgi:hypothetical protein